MNQENNNNTDITLTKRGKRVGAVILSALAVGGLFAADAVPTPDLSTPRSTAVENINQNTAHNALSDAVENAPAPVEAISVPAGINQAEAAQPLPDDPNVHVK